MNEEQDFLNRVEKELADEIGVMMLVCGQSPDGDDFWAYVSVAPSRYDDFLAIQKSGKPYILTEWGEILHHGLGKEPSKEDNEFMEAEYGVDHDLDLLAEDLHNFSKKNET